MNKEILRLALPSVVSNITVPILSLVDIAIVGHIGDAIYLAAISVGAMIFNVMYWVLGFLRMSVSGLTSQSLGRDDCDGIRLLFNNSLRKAMKLGLMLLLLFLPLRNAMLWAFQVGTDTQTLVISYFNVCIWGAPAVLSSFALNGWLIGMQDSKSPMKVAITQNIINIILSLFFVFALKMDVVGVALGTMLSQWIAFAMLLLLARKHHRNFAVFERIPEKADIMLEKSQLKLNLQIFLRSLCLVAVNMYFTSAGSAQGALILAVNTLLMTFFTIFSYIMDGFAFAGEAMSGKFHGAADKEALDRLHHNLLIWGVGLVTAFTFIYAFGGNFLLRILTSDKTVIDAAQTYFHFVLLIPICGVMAFIYDGLFIGMTRAKEMLISSFIATMTFFLLYFSLRRHLGNDSLWYALLTYLLLRGVILSLMFNRKRA
jgi:MATE family multidrug resistance protein